MNTKTLILKEDSIELYKCSVSGASYYLIVYDQKKYIRSSLCCAYSLIDFLKKNKQ